MLERFSQAAGLSGVVMSTFLDDARALARSHLTMFGLGDGPGPTEIAELARCLDIRIIPVPCWEEPTFPAVEIHSTFADHRVILVNSLLGQAEQNYSITHEIGHIVSDHRQPRSSVLEQIADAYAREVMLPLKRLIGQIRQHGGDARFLAGLNGVPIGPMRIRLQEIAVTLATELNGPWQSAANLVIAVVSLLVMDAANIVNLGIL